MSIEGVLKDQRYRLPVFGSGSDIKAGAFLQRGATPATNNGELIKASGTSATPDILGQLLEIHDFSVTGDHLIAGTAHVTHPVLLVQPFRVFRLKYDPASKIDATGNVTTTTMTITSLEDNIDAAFFYVTAGTGAGQTNYATASAAGSCTLKAAFTTDLDNTADLIKILPRFHQVIGLNSDGTALSSQAAAGAVTGVVIDSYIERNNRLEQLDATKHAALTGLDDLRSINFYADVAIVNTIPYAVD